LISIQYKNRSGDEDQMKKKKCGTKPDNRRRCHHLYS